jgi:hypothetical protein
MCVVAAQ